MPKQRKPKSIPFHRRFLSEAWQKEWETKKPEDKVRDLFDGLAIVRDSFLNELEQEYNRTENALFVWEAHRLARRWKKPIPEWVLQYMDGTARGLLNPNNSESDISAILDLDQRGKHTKFSQFYDSLLRKAAACKVANLIEEGKSHDPFADARDYIWKEFGKEYEISTIAQWYKNLA